MTANRTPNLPIRRVDDLEIPINGTWSIVRASSVVKSSGRHRNRRQLHVLAGRFEIGDEPGDSSLRIDLDDSTLIATTAARRSQPTRDVGVGPGGNRPRARRA